MPFRQQTKIILLPTMVISVNYLENDRSIFYDAHFGNNDGRLSFIAIDYKSHGKTTIIN